MGEGEGQRQDTGKRGGVWGNNRDEHLGEMCCLKKRVAAHQSESATPRGPPSPSPGPQSRAERDSSAAKLIPTAAGKRPGLDDPEGPFLPRVSKVL